MAVSAAWPVSLSHPFHPTYHTGVIDIYHHTQLFLRVLGIPAQILRLAQQILNPPELEDSP